MSEVGKVEEETKAPVPTPAEVKIRPLRALVRVEMVAETDGKFSGSWNEEAVVMESQMDIRLSEVVERLSEQRRKDGGGNGVPRVAANAG